MHFSPHFHKTTSTFGDILVIRRSSIIPTSGTSRPMHLRPVILREGQGWCTLPETDIAPENGWLEDEFPFGMAQFQGPTVSFRGCISGSYGADLGAAKNPLKISIAKIAKPWIFMFFWQQTGLMGWFTPPNHQKKTVLVGPPPSPKKPITSPRQLCVSKLPRTVPHPTTW